MSIKQEIANKLSVLIKDNDLKKYSGKDQFIQKYRKTSFFGVWSCQ